MKKILLSALCKASGCFLFSCLLHLHAEPVLTTIVHFDSTNGYVPRCGLTMGDNGDIYGTLSNGGWFDAGTVFCIKPDGKCVILVTFDGHNGSNPSSLIRGKDGFFYGITLHGGTSRNGSIFRMTSDGTITTLASFQGGGKAYSPWGLIQEHGGNLFGRANSFTGNTTFELTSDGKLLIPATNTNNIPIAGDGFLKSKNGTSYGTIFPSVTGHPQYPYGAVFRINADGTRTTLVDFDGTNGAYPLPGSLLLKDDNIYGITTRGGAFNQGTVFKINLTNASTQSTKIDNQRIPVPILLHAVSNNVDPKLMDLMQAPIAFYGKVVDEQNQPVSNAQISFHWSDLTARGSEASSATSSDSNGLFSLIGKQGGNMSVSVGKQGYYAFERGEKYFRYSKMDASRKHVPDPLNPVIFRLLKKGQGADLNAHNFPPGMGQTWQLHRNGTPVELDLLNGSRNTVESGQLKLEYWHDASNPKARQYDWKLKMSISGGGFVQTDEEFAFKAPEAGYQESILFDMPATNRVWLTDLRKKYYVKLANGNFGKIDFYFLSYNGVFNVHSLINPRGSRDLEPK